MNEHLSQDIQISSQFASCVVNIRELKDNPWSQYSLGRF